MIPDRTDSEDLATKGYELGFEYERTYHGCSQCTLAALMDLLGEQDDGLFQAASGLGAGIGLSGGATCGALIGGVLVIGQRYGRQRRTFRDLEGVRFRCYAVSRKLLDKFESHYGSNRCADVQRALLGRAFDLSDPSQWDEFVSKGGHDTHCPSVVGNVVKWTIEILRSYREETGQGQDDASG